MKDNLVRLFINPLNPENKNIYGFEVINDLIDIYNDDTIVSKEELNHLIVNSNFKNNIDILEFLEKEKPLVKSFNKMNRFNDLLFNSNYSLRKIRKIVTKEEKEYFKSLEDFNNKKEEVIKNSKTIESYYKEYDLNSDRFVNYKYYSSVVLLVKNENRYLKEWLDWHLVDVGFDHIYIYDNYTKEDDKGVKEYLESINYDKLDRITINKFSTPKRENKNLQTECYNYHLKKYKEEVKWSAFIDIDEFIQYKNINEFLKTKKEYVDISIWFKEYNADGHENYNPRIPVQERFTNVVDNKEVESNNADKHIVQNYKISHFKTHYPKYNPLKHLCYRCTMEEMYYKHFYTKSYEEWIDKITRGSCDKDYLRKYTEFFLYNPDMIELYNSELEFLKQSYGEK